MGVEAIGTLTSGITIGGITNFAFIMVISIIGGVLLALAVLLVIRQFLYKTRCIILEELSDGGTMISMDKGRFKRRRDKTDVFLLKKHKRARLSPPPSNAISYDNKGRKVAFIKKFGNGLFDYYPLGISLRGMQVYLTPFLSSRQNWISTEIKRQHQKYGGFWEKYGGLVMVGGMVIFSGIMLVILFKMNQDSATAISKGMEHLSTAITSLKESSVQVISPPGV